jgi:hypothetical protein
MELTVREFGGQRYLEGRPGQPLMATLDDTVKVIEQCMEHRLYRLLLYAGNLPEGFFDLSSGDAGDILQKFRNYRIKLAVVLDPEPQRLSQPFHALLVEENSSDEFHVCADRSAAEAWLLRP